MVKGMGRFGTPREEVKLQATTPEALTRFQSPHARLDGLDNLLQPYNLCEGYHVCERSKGHENKREGVVR